VRGAADASGVGEGAAAAPKAITKMVAPGADIAAFALGQSRDSRYRHAAGVAVTAEVVYGLKIVLQAADCHTPYSR